MDALHCAASHGHWRFNSASCLHRLPRRYTRLIVVLRVRGKGAIEQKRKSGPGSLQVSKPFIVETGGRINATGLQVLSRSLPLEAEGKAGLTRRHGRAALRGISRALAL